MARNYTVDFQTPAGTNLTILEVVSPGTTTRAWIFEMVVGSDATPADVATEYNVIRGTVSGTGTGVTARPLDPASPAAIMTPKGGTFTGQTKTAASSLYMLPLNQRATYRFVAIPGCEWVVPATTDAWVGLESINSTGTPNTNVTMQWAE